MMQTGSIRSGVLFVVWVIAGIAHAADRTTCFVPLAPDAVAGPVAETSLFPDQAMGEPDHAWRAYRRLWQAHHADPANTVIRRYIGLPLSSAVEIRTRRGRSAPRTLGWRAGDYQQVESRHFTIYSRADNDTNQRIAEDLERCYWIWTQLYFPLWEGRAQVTATLGGMKGDEEVSEFLKSKTSRLTTRAKLKVVLFRDADEYRRTLAPQMPGIERSTGFYGDAAQTTYLYASETDQDDDVATRRHELTHQLFREATRSGLGRTMPGQSSGFWLIEGIAGYMESLFVTDELATVGGWDSPRLQFARYRVLANRDTMPLDELTADGRVAVQSRDDLARWYAHAIAQTHCLMDGEQPGHRRWIYHQLAERYKLAIDMATGGPPREQDRLLTEFPHDRRPALEGEPNLARNRTALSRRLPSDCRWPSDDSSPTTAPLARPVAITG